MARKPAQCTLRLKLAPPIREVEPRCFRGEAGLLGQITKAVLERALGAELDDHLGYVRGDPAGNGSGNLAAPPVDVVQAQPGDLARAWSAVSPPTLPPSTRLPRCPRPACCRAEPAVPYSEHGCSVWGPHDGPAAWLTTNGWTEST